MKILAVSDIELGFIYNLQLAQRFSNIDLLISCGDLPYYYLEFMISMLNKPLYYVKGNHNNKVEYSTDGERHSPWGAIDLHRRTVCTEQGLILAGIEGCNRYNKGEQQYTQSEMWNMVLGLTPSLLYNRIRYGRFLDIFITHAPPWGIHDMDDLPHHGIKAFRWFIQVFKPNFHLHGHIHVYHNQAVTKTQLGPTTVINCYGFREISYEFSRAGSVPIEIDKSLA